MLKVLFITRKWPPAVGGMETYSVELSEELKRLVELNIHYLPGKKDGAPPSFFAILLFFFTSLHQCFKSRNVDVIHLGDMALWPIGMVAGIFNKRIKLVISTHGTDVAYHLRVGILPVLYKIYLAFGALIINAYSKVVANSHATAVHCRSHGFNNIYVIPLGVRTENAVKMFHSCPNNYILFVGRLARRKGVGWFIGNVLPLLPEEVSMKIAGTIWDDEEFNAVSASSRIEYLGPVYGEKLAELRRNAIAVIMPNITCEGRDFEGFGLTAVEASADGAVLLASGIDGIVDAVIDGKTGWLLPSQDVIAWKNKIDEIMRWDSIKRDSFTNIARETACQFYSWGRVARDVLEIYNKKGFI